MPPRDLVHAPDGRTWYETAIDEAEKRGRLQAELEQCHAKSTCCCGDYVKDHGMGSGHAPVSMYDYAIDNANAEVERLRAVLLNIQAQAETGRPVDSAKLATRCRAALS
jgi:hypothetical protein